MRRWHRPLVAAGVSLMTPAAALAQEPADAIIVTGHGLDAGPATPAYDVETIEHAEIASSASGRLEDVLSSIAGFSQFRRSDSRSANPSAQGANLRALGGNAASRTLVLLDGVPVANPFFGYIPYSALSPDRLESIRVTRGGGVGAFGAGAVAGTIELTSARAAQIGSLNGTALVNDRGETQMSATVGSDLGGGFLVGGVQWDRGDGFWTTPVSQRVDASTRAAYETVSGSLRAVAPLTDAVEVQAAVLAYDDARTLRFKGADSTSEGQQASLRFVGRGQWQFDVLGYVQAQDFSNVVVSAATFRPTLDQNRTPTTAIGGKAELRPPVSGTHVLRIGADLKLSDGHLLEIPLSASGPTAVRRAGGRQSDIGFYAEDDWTLGNVIVTAGARVDRWTIRDGYFHAVNMARLVIQDDNFSNRAGWESNARAGLVWRADTTVALRASVYTGFRLPTLNELYRPYVVFPVTTRANPTLNPERLRGFEAGLDWHPIDQVSLSFTAFDNRLKNAISNVTIDNNLRERQNVKAIRARGLEANAAIDLGKFSIDGALAWTHSEVDAPGDVLDGMRPAQVPEFAASTTFAWIPRDGWRIAATLRHIGAQYESDTETDELPPATTLDSYVEVPLSSRFTAILRGENLTDEAIVTRNQGGSIDLGTPRTIWGGIRVAFR